MKTRILFAMVLLSACAAETEAPEAPPPQTYAILEVNPSALDFGALEAPETATLTLTVTNPGLDALWLEDVGIDGPDAFEVLDTDFPRILGPEASTEVLIAATATVDEALEGDVVVHSNDLEEQVLLVPASAQALAPMIEIEPAEHDFGTPHVGCVEAAEVIIANAGRLPLTIDAMEYAVLVGTGLEADGLWGEAVTLNAGDSVPVTVTFDPANTLAARGELRVWSDAANRADGLATATQDGMALPALVETDSFTQPAPDAVDYLIVIDSSSSMVEEETPLALNFATWFSLLGPRDLDYQLAVTTMDAADAGQFQGTTPIVVPSTPDPGGTLSANVNVGTSGSDVSQGGHAAWLALEASINDVGVNGGFLRHDAALEILLVSDEQDMSSSAMGWSPANYVSYLQGLKSDPTRVRVSNVTGGMTGCAGAGGYAASGSDYVSASNIADGLSVSICDGSWALSLGGMFNVVPSTTFSLSIEPSPESIEVRRNGSLIATGWNYDLSINAVVFQSSSVPDEGDVIEIDYSPAACL
ncbi:MAG: choice-of-anchor D domain-containing protein [Proteobacteria bacterium]|nr:choice-of-anchor D domain-containing protein [Pseudomonadota bacterium]